MGVEGPCFCCGISLDGKGADRNARGVGSESPTEEPASREELLGFGDRLAYVEELVATLMHPESGSTNHPMELHQRAASAASIPMEEIMNFEEIIQEIREALGLGDGDFEGGVKELVEAALKAAELETQLEAMTELLGTLEDSNLELAERLEVTEADLETAQVALEAKATEFDALVEEHDSVVEELNTMKAEQAEREADELREARMAQLPEAFVAALNQRDEESRNKVIGRLMEMTDEEFEEHVALLQATIGNPTPEGYTTRSQREGILPVTPPAGEGKFAIDVYFK